MANIPHFNPVRMTASSEEAAISQALMMAGVTREEVEVEVLDRTEKGVTVRVSPRREQAEVTETSATPIVEDAAPVAAAETLVDDVIEPAGSYADSNEVESDVEDNEDVAVSDDETTLTTIDAEEALEEATEEAAPAPVVAREADPAQVQRAQELAQEFLERMGLVASVRQVPPPSATVEEIERPVPVVYLDIEGEDVGILIGKHGQTLQSFQYLLNLTLNNRVHESDGEEHEALRVVVDAGGYRTRRAQSLEQTALSAAARAKRDRRSVRLEPMPAHERRLVHIALRGDGDITTGSEGREPHRYVVITPAGSKGNGGYGSHGGRGRGPRRHSPYGSGSSNFGGHMPPRGR